MLPTTSFLLAVLPALALAQTATRTTAPPGYVFKSTAQPPLPYTTCSPGSLNCGNSTSSCCNGDDAMCCGNGCAMDDWTCVILGAGGGEMICHDDADNCYDVVAEVEMDDGRRVTSEFPVPMPTGPGPVRDVDDDGEVDDDVLATGVPSSTATVVGNGGERVGGMGGVAVVVGALAFVFF